MNKIFVSNTLIQQLKTMADPVHVAYELVNNPPNKMPTTKFKFFVAPTATDNPGVSQKGD